MLHRPRVLGCCTWYRIKNLRFIKQSEADKNENTLPLSQNGLGENNLIFTSVVLGGSYQQDAKTCFGNLQHFTCGKSPKAHCIHSIRILSSRASKMNYKARTSSIICNNNTHRQLRRPNRMSIIFPFCNVNKSIIQSFSFDELSEDGLKEEVNDICENSWTRQSSIIFCCGVVGRRCRRRIIIPFSQEILEAKKIDLCKSGIELVNIGGIAFNHFGLLFNNDDERKRLLSKCCDHYRQRSKDNGDISDRAQSKGFRET